ncbi:putative repeat protein (TIGR02543 family) [Paenibacillus cellulosilyticus]|uniref:Putative repeat protein (TIGR02543 family) n=1 Tax=Paenibacillus cellulosilyticus TaxID=375489 RepID=A0A2V2YTA5_9BACL|nr:X2-like carbohydrate binding domain-containing protein [Paenibacillus cellulosilyticus]PWW01251.1 putative repeat protein (TIGR02543 family) [Paenibacillus cellulosilyticus]
MNLYKRTRRFLAAILSVVIVLGLIPTTGKASAATTMVKVVQIAAAQNNSIALKSDGTVFAWGNNVTSWAKPPEGLTDVVEIYAKDTVFLARKSNGTVVVWGSNEASETTIPNGLNNVISMASAGHHTLMVSKSGVISGAGTAVAWGLNGNGQSDVPVDAQAAVTKVAAGSYYSMALKINGTVVDWGTNGLGSTLKPADLSNVVAIDAGYMYALALKSDGTVAAWGKEYDENGILNVSGLTGITAISANSTHALALKSDGTVVGWGDNKYGKATPPVGLTDVVAISAGVDHSLALKSDGTVVSWGLQTSVPGNNELSSLTISEGTSNIAFDPSVTSYQYDISPYETSVHIDAVLKDTASSELYINDQLQKSGSTVAVAVPATGAVIKILVKPYLKESRTYTLTISRDREPPSVTFSPNGSSTTPLRTISTSVKVTDTTSGVDPSTLEYAWSQAASAPASGWANFSLIPYTQLAQFTHAGADGNWYLHIRAKDYTGKLAEVSSEPFLIDNTAPVLSLTMKKADDTAYLEDSWSNQAVVISAAAIDAQSANVTVKYTLDGGKTWTSYTDPITIPDSGIYTVIIQASDAIGNVQTESRTIRITEGDLKLTITKVKVTGGDDYSSGDWTNSSVRVTATAETKAGETILADSFTWDMNEVDMGKYSGQQIFFFTDGMNSGEFKVKDSLGNSLTAPYAVNIDRTAPTVSFSPNGNAALAREASVTATVADSGGSGLVESALEYVWTQSTGEPTDGWLPLNNGSTLTKEGVDGNWYLHIRGKDAAGNEINAVSSPFVLDNAALNSTLSPDTGSFDKKESAQADVDTMLMLNGNTLVGISNGTDELLPGMDYVITGNTVVIQKSYLILQPEGAVSLTFTFSGGSVQTLTITIDDTTPLNSTISPDIASFDKKISAQADVDTTLTLNGNTLTGISNDGIALVSGTDYSVSGDVVTILKNYLASQPLGVTSLTFTFSSGAIQTLIFMISDTTPSNSTISPNAGSFDKKTSAQADIDTTLTLNGNTLTGISNGAETLVLGTDYTVTGNTVTLLKSYLAVQAVGTTSLTFTFSGGANQTLTITVNDTTPQNSTISPNAGSFNKKVSAQADVSATLTLNGNTLIGISNGAGTLVLGTDYTVTGNTVTILKSYLAEQAVGTTSLTFTFSGGANQTLTITVNDTTPQNSTISPNAASFDKKTSVQADVSTTLTLSGNTLIGISNGAETLVLGTDYTVTGNTVTLLKSYLAAQAVGTTSLTFTFSGGADQTLAITVNDTTPQNSTISPNAGSFNKKVSAQADVDTTLTLNGNTLTGISNGAETLVLGTDYTVTGNTVTILKSYLAEQSVGATSLTFTFSGGADQTLTITVNDTTPQNSTVSPNVASFDKKISAQADVDTTLTLNGNTLTGISNGAGTLVLGTDYTVTGNTVTILKSYLAEQSVGATSLTFTFSGGADQTLTITVNDTTPQNSTVSPNVASFDKKISAQADVDTTLTLNGNTLTGISNGAGTLVLGTDYTVTGNTVTILKSYLAEQSVGATSLTFTFSGGADQTLTITVNDTTPQNSTVSPNVASFDKKVSAQADVDTTLTLNGNTLTGISNGAEALVLGTDYTVTGNTVTILKSYLAAQSVGTKSLTFTFSGGENQTLTITVNDTTPQNSTISPNAASFDKKTSAQADVDTTLTLNGNTLIGISNGAEVLVLGTDYTVTGNTVTILKSYLAAQSVGTTSLTFTFSGGADQTLTITISDTTLPSYTVTYSGNGSTGGSVPTDSGFYEQGVSVLVSGNPGSLSKTGYTFAGWNTQADGNGTNYSAGATVTIGTANVTLYAKWISNIADLSDLTLSGNTLNPTFDAATTSYTVNVTTSMSSITVTATVRDAVDATVTATAYNNAGTITSGPIPLTSGAVSPSFPLNVGINLINLVVTAEDGTTKTYAITVNRASNNGSGGSIVPPTVPSEEQAPGTSTEEPPTDTSPTFAFSDIVGHWAETYIKQAAGIGIVTGYPDGTFKPNHTVTRAEFTVMLMNALKLPVEAAALSFTDTAKIGSWAQKAVAQAVQAGIINGYADGSFRPDAEITRAEMAMMLANALHLSLGANVATSFADDMDIPAWAKAAVSAIKTLGLIQGKSSNIFDPDASTTRAEAVTALMRMLAQQS